MHGWQPRNLDIKNRYETNGCNVNINLVSLAEESEEKGGHTNILDTEFKVNPVSTVSHQCHICVP